MKKTLTLILALIMTVSLALPAAAADTSYDTAAVAAAEAAVGALVGADEDAAVTLSDDLAKAASDEASTPEKLAGFIAGFAFVEESEIEAVSQRIADSSTYRVTVIEGEVKTVYVAVDLLKNPEIFDARVFRSATEKIRDKCKEYAIADGMGTNNAAYNLMSYYHIAGELALHMILADFSSKMGGDDWNILVKDIYKRSIISDLNVDESRFPAKLIEAFGKIISFIINVLY